MLVRTYDVMRSERLLASKYSAYDIIFICTDGVFVLFVLLLFLMSVLETRSDNSDGKSWKRVICTTYIIWRVAPFAFTS